MGKGFNIYANVNDTSNTDVTIIPAATGRRWEVTSIIVSTGDAGTFTLKSGSTAILGPMYMAANTTLPLDLEDVLRCNAANEALVLTKGTNTHRYTVFCQYRDMA